jgi:hypothetical protein
MAYGAKEPGSSPQHPALQGRVQMARSPPCECSMRCARRCKGAAARSPHLVWPRCTTAARGARLLVLAAVCRRSYLRMCDLCAAFGGFQRRLEPVTAADTTPRQRQQTAETDRQRQHRHRLTVGLSAPPLPPTQMPRGASPRLRAENKRAQGRVPAPPSILEIKSPRERVVRPRLRARLLARLGGALAAPTPPQNQRPRD